MRPHRHHIKCAPCIRESEQTGRGQRSSIQSDPAPLQSCDSVMFFLQRSDHTQSYIGSSAVHDKDSTLGLTSANLLASLYSVCTAASVTATAGSSPARQQRVYRHNKIIKRLAT